MSFYHSWPFVWTYSHFCGVNRKAIGTLIWILFCKAFLCIPLGAPIQKQKCALSRVFQSHFFCSIYYSVALAMQNHLFSEIMIFSFLLLYTRHSLLWEYFSQLVHLPKFCCSRSRFKCHFSESCPDFSPIDLLPPGCHYSSHTWHHPTVWCPVPHPVSTARPFPQRSNSGSSHVAATVSIPIASCSD